MKLMKFCLMVYLFISLPLFASGKSEIVDGPKSAKQSGVDIQAHQNKKNGPIHFSFVFKNTLVETKDSLASTRLIIKNKENELVFSGEVVIKRKSPTYLIEHPTISFSINPNYLKTTTFEVIDKRDTKCPHIRDFNLSKIVINYNVKPPKTSK